MKDWILTLCVTALITCCVLAVTPEGRTKRVVRLVCAFAVIAAMLRPLKGFDYDLFSKKTAQLRREADEYSQDVEEAGNSMSRLFIQEECEAYIMDKGAALGANLREASVTLRWDTDGYWYPESAVLTGDPATEAAERLRGGISSELGIPPERITWVDADESGQN